MTFEPLELVALGSDGVVYRVARVARQWWEARAELPDGTWEPIPTDSGEDWESRAEALAACVRRAERGVV